MQQNFIFTRTRLKNKQILISEAPIPSKLPTETPPACMDKLAAQPSVIHNMAGYE